MTVEHVILNYSLYEHSVKKLTNFSISFFYHNYPHLLLGKLQNHFFIPSNFEKPM